MRPQDRLRMLLFFTPWVSIPLALLGVFLTLTAPLIALVPFGWLAWPFGVVELIWSVVAVRRYREIAPTG